MTHAIGCSGVFRVLPAGRQAFRGMIESTLR